MNKQILSLLKIVGLLILPIILLFATYTVVMNRNNNLSRSFDSKDSRASENLAPVMAFPGAQGFGAQTPGGRGGRILAVTNLSDTKNTSDPQYAGSFRWALNAYPGESRIIIFKVGGVIRGTDAFEIKNPYITIAGQTAPGDGIIIKGTRIRIMTHDVIIRGLRMRVGDEAGYDFGNRDGITISGEKGKPAYNIIVDHNSVAWAVDENGSTWDNSSSHDQVHDITFSWNIIAEGLKCGPHPETTLSCTNSSFTSHHSMGFLIGDNNKNVVLHHNLFSSNVGRNPRFGPDSTGAFINNVVYNWGLEPTTVSGKEGTTRADIIGNYYIPTQATATRQGAKHGIYLKCDLKNTSEVYVKGNIGSKRTADNQDEWSEVVFEQCSGGVNLINVKRTAPVTGALNLVIAHSAEAAYSLVTSQAGAATPDRDIVDQRIIAYVLDRKSPDETTSPGIWHINSQNDASHNGKRGFPDYIGGEAPDDTDQDGIPNAWETEYGLNPNLNDSGSTACSGYTWIEEYVNSLIPSQYPPAQCGVPTPSLYPITPTSYPTSTPVPTVPPSYNTPTPVSSPIPTLFPSPTTIPTGEKLTLYPIDDSYVNANHTRTNYGGSSTLQVDEYPEKKMIYLKFDLAPLLGKTIKSAKLKFYVADGSKNDHFIYVLENRDWNEKTMTYDTRPIDSGELIYTINKVQTSSVTLSLENGLRRMEGRMVTLMIDSNENGTDGLDFYSKEKKGKQPTLTVEY